MKTHAEFLEELKEYLKLWDAKSYAVSICPSVLIKKIEQFEAQLGGDNGAVDIKSQIYCRQLIKSVDDSRRIHFLHEENAKLKRLLAEACSLIAGEWSIIPIEELQQWYEDNKKQEENK